MTDNWMPNKRKHQSKRTVFDMQAEIGRLQGEIERLLAEIAELQRQKDYWQALAISRALENKP